MSRRISEERKAAYYIGGIISIIGVALFASVFITGIMNLGDFHNFESRAKSSMTRAFSGIALITLGAVVSNIGRAGLAGSGVVLDPEKAREDLEPFSRQAGGMLKDVLDEADICIGSSADEEPEQVIMIRCQDCGKLNEEDSKFCQECGRPI